MQSHNSFVLNEPKRNFRQVCADGQTFLRTNLKRIEFNYYYY